MYRDHYQTMRVAFEQISQGRRPWTALGDFMNDWYKNAGIGIGACSRGTSGERVE